MLDRALSEGLGPGLSRRRQTKQTAKGGQTGCQTGDVMKVPDRAGSQMGGPVLEYRRQTGHLVKVSCRALSEGLGPGTS